jgi:hypothetical protein
MSPARQVIKGSDALRILESSASRELKRTRELVENASSADIASYFKGAQLGELSPNANSELVSAAIAGGQWGFNALLSRLASTEVHQADYENVANELLEIVSPHAKILNFARFRATAVQSYVAQCSGRSLKLQTLDLSKAELSKHEDQIAWIQNASISNSDTLQNWIEKVDDFCGELSQRQELDEDAIKTAGSRNKRGTVSTRSISSYSKHWKSFAPEILMSELGLKLIGDKDDSIASKVMPLINYRPRSWSQLQKDLRETVSTRRSYQSAKKTGDNSRSEGKLVTVEHYIDGRLVSISYTLPGVDEDLIQPALNSIRAQLLRNTKQPKVSFTMKTENNSLSVEIEKASKEDLETLKVLLNSYK